MLRQLELGDRVAVHFVRAVDEAQRTRFQANIAASGKSSLTPPPPWAWIAQSMICCATFGTSTLIIAISARAPLLPTVSIMYAAFSVRSRAASIIDARLGDALLRHRALGDRLAESDARERPLAHQLERALGRADRAHAVVDAAGPEPALRDLEAAPFAEQDVGDRYADVLERLSAWPCGASS